MNTTVRTMVAAIAALALSALSACGSTTDDESASGSVTVGTTQAWVGFNPYQADQGNSIGIALGQAIYPSAFHVQGDQTTTLNEDLLESAEVTATKPQTVVYKIRDDAVWSDGEPITADDFKYLWQHLRGTDESLQVTTTTGYSQIASVSAAGNPKTVKVVFSAPFADWRSLFAMLLPAHYMAGLGSDATSWNTGLLDDAAPAGGPFTVQENKKDEYVTLARNPKWYGDDAELDSVTVRYFGDSQALVQALSSGEAQYAFDLLATRSTIAQAKATSGVTTEVVPTTNQQFLNTQFSDPIMGERAVREAIAIAVDPEAVAQKVFGDDVADLLTTHHVVAPISPAYEDNRPEGFGSGDAEAAAGILEDAGWIVDEDGVRTKNGKRLELVYPVRSENQLHKQVGVILQDVLKEIGIELRIEAVPTADWFTMLGGADYDLGLGNMPATAFPVSWYSALYPCDAGYNFARYCNEKVDTLFAEANAELDLDKQAKLINQIDQRLWADVANIPLWEVPLVVVYSPQISGIDPALPKEYQLLAAAGWRIGG